MNEFLLLKNTIESINLYIQTQSSCILESRRYLFEEKKHTFSFSNSTILSINVKDPLIEKEILLKNMKSLEFRLKQLKNERDNTENEIMETLSILKNRNLMIRNQIERLTNSF